MNKLIAITVIIPFAVAAYAEPLWGKAELDASVNTIEQLYPNGRVVEPSDRNKLPSGDVMRYRVDDISIAGVPFSAQFFFNTDRLGVVGLEHKSSENESVCDRVVVDIKTALSAKYGTPLRDDYSVSLGKTWEATWVNGRVSVSMHANFYSLPKCFIWITYSTSVAKDTDKL